MSQQLPSYHETDGLALASWLLQPENEDIRQLFVAHLNQNDTSAIIFFAKPLDAEVPDPYEQRAWDVYGQPPALNDEQSSRWRSIMGQLYKWHSGSSFSWVISYACRVVTGTANLPNDN